MKLPLTLGSSQRRAMSQVGVIQRISFFIDKKVGGGGGGCSKEVDLSVFEKNEINSML